MGAGPPEEGGDAGAPPPSVEPGDDDGDADDDAAEADDANPADDDAAGSDDDSASEEPSVEGACESSGLPLQPLRRLSSEEYLATLRDLFGALGPRVSEGSLFPATLLTSGFTSDAEANVVNTAESNAIEDEAERIAGLVDEDPEAFLNELMPCSLDPDSGDASIDDCVDDFIVGFGERAYRRPLSEAEVALARRAYDGSREAGDARFAFAGLLQYFVQSPALLYRVERGQGGPNAELLRLSGFERATRLSYFLTGSMPDEELLAAARADELRSAEQVRAQAERLLGSERFLERAVAFHRDWLELHGFDYKEESLFPDFAGVRPSLEQETARYVRFAFEAEATIETLLGGDTLVVNSTLAEFYGVDAPGATEAEWVPVVLPNRRGLITQAALMATLATSTATRPIHRGGFFQTQFLCRELPALPANLDIQAPLVDTSELPTARERLSPLTNDGTCSTCHAVINPVGLALENYDAMGAWRTQENGADIDASGSLSLDGSSIEFDGPVALAEALASSREASNCYVTFWYRNAMGRPEFGEDVCSIQAVQQAVADSGGDARQLLLALVQTEAFLFTRRPE